MRGVGFWWAEVTRIVLKTSTDVREANKIANYFEFRRREYPVNPMEKRTKECYGAFIYSLVFRVVNTKRGGIVDQNSVNS